MKWHLPILSIAGFVLAACNTDVPTQSPTQLATVQAPSLGSDPTYYRADVHITFHGGLRRDIPMERFYHVARSYRDGTWALDLTNRDSPAPGVPSPDVARVTIDGLGHVKLFSRKGAAITRADMAALRSRIQERDQNRTGSFGGPSLATLTAPTRLSGATSGVNPQSGPLSHHVIGVAGRARSLARFASAEYDELPASEGRRRFTRSDGGQQITVEVDGVTGAAIREEVRQEGRR